MSAAVPDPEFEALLEYLRLTRGFQFGGYKRPTLTRRFLKRLAELDLKTFGEYADYLEFHPDEFELLFNTILINVTSFFRDPGAWEYLAEHVVPQCIDQAGPTGAIRVWTAGCASGEEAYTLAMLFAEALGDETFRERVKIYATDVDDDALAQARVGTYSAKSLAAVPEELRERYFEGAADHRAFRSDLRRSLIFGRHDLTRDAPISRLSLMTCRNTLMYFNAETQANIVRRLHYALLPDATLFLGRAEMLLSFGELFTPLSTPNRVFTKVSRATAKQVGPIGPIGPFAARSARFDDNEQLLMMAFETAPGPQLLIDSELNVAAINKAARNAFVLARQDVGRPFQDLEISYRPIDLRTPIDRSERAGETVVLNAVEHRGSADSSRFYDIIISSLAAEGQGEGSLVTFADVTTLRLLELDMKRVTEDLETAYEELQSTNEELETTNEELQSTIEELETTNEELQSTNEELETTNEELRSTNEELETMNDELRLRTTEAVLAREYLNSIVDGVSVAVVVLDAAHRVQTWNVVAEEMWGLRAEEVLGESLFALDTGLPVEQLRNPVVAALDLGQGEVENVLVNSVNRRGRPFVCRVTFAALKPENMGVVMLMEALSDI